MIFRPGAIGLIIHTGCEVLKLDNQYGLLKFHGVNEIPSGKILVCHPG